MEVPGRRFGQQGCDEVTNPGPVIYCEPCGANGRQQVALAYCTDCNEFICTACEQTHRGSKISRQHTILDQTTMPTHKLSSADGTFCPTHGGRFLEYYCQDHGVFGCGVCVNLSHRQCKNVDLITDAALRYERSTEYKNLLSKLQELTKSLKEGIRLSDANRDHIEKHYGTLLSDVKQFRKEIDAILDSLEETIVNDAEQLKEECFRVSDTVKDSYKSMESEIDTMSSDIGNGIRFNQNQQFLIGAKNAEKQVVKFETQMTRLANDHKLVLKSFKPDEKLKTFLQSVKGLGKLDDSANQAEKREMLKDATLIMTKSTPTKETTVSSGNESATTSSQIDGVVEKGTKKSMSRTWKAQFMGEIFLNMKQEKCNVYITSGTLLSDGSLILVDNGNDCLKRVDPTKKEVRLLMKLPFKPWDITLFKEHQYVLSSENNLVFINIEEIVSIDRELPVEGDCRGLAFVNDTFIVACAAPNPCVRIINIEGNVLRVIKHDTNGQLLFQNPWYLRISSDRKYILVSDFEKHRVTSLTLDGHVMSHYGNKNLKGPTGMAVDQEGAVILAGRKSHNLHLISADCKPLQILLQKRVGEELPQAVIWCERRGSLFVSHNWRTRMCNSLSVYNIQ